ncbi:MAG: restriction endonuclease subunit S [Burkholderiales bacterium]
MKKGWPIKPLQSLCDDFKQDIVDGPFGSELQRKDYITEGVPVLKIQNVKPFAIELKRMDYVSAAKFQELRRHSYRRGDIVMTKLGRPLGVSAIVEDLDEGVIVADLVRIRAQQINTKYLCYHLNSQRTNDFINSMQKGTTRPRVTLSVVRELPIYTPPLAEQQRIVGLLDEAFEGLATANANAEKNLQNARALFESHLQSVFTQRGKGWKRKPLGSLCDLISGQHIDAKDYNTEGKGVGYLTGPSDFGFLNPVITKWSEHPKRMAKRGDILVTVKGSGVGKINLLDAEEVAISRQLMAVRATAADVNYLYAFLSTNFDYFQSLSKGAAIPGISREDVLDLMCPMPPPEEQQAIVKLIHAMAEETQRLARLYERKLAALEALKKSLLHQAFTGEL